MVIHPLKSIIFLIPIVSFVCECESEGVGGSLNQRTRKCTLEVIQVAVPFLVLFG